MHSIEIETVNIAVILYCNPKKLNVYMFMSQVIISCLTTNWKEGHNILLKLFN